MQYENKVKDWTDEVGSGGIVVYHSDDWTDYEHTPDEHHAGWPYPPTPSDFHIERILWDPDVETIIVVVHRQGERE